MRDAEVVTSIVAGDPDGLAAAYDGYADPLFKYCSTLLSDPADAADAVQDTFVIAASRLEGLREPERFRSWLYTVARSECLRILRTRRSEKGTPALDEAPDVTDGPSDDSGQAEKAGLWTLWTLFEDATAGLSPGEREVIELQLRQGLEAGEVATVLGVSRNRAHTLLSRARDQLEICLAVLLVGRAGRDACRELGSMLTGWDGRLTVPLRERVHRHIEFCMICGTRRDLELRSAMLLELSPAAALAAGAAESFRVALGAPSGLKSHTIALATGQGPSAVAHSTAVLSRAGTFGKHGFPRPVRAGKAGLAGQHGAGGANADRAMAGGAMAGGMNAGGVRAGGVRAGLRSAPRRQAAAATVVLAVVIAAVAFALTGNSGHFAPAADPKPVASLLAPRPASPVAKTTKSKPAPKPPAATPVPVPTTPAPTPTTPLPVPTTPTPAPTPTTPRPAPATPGPSPAPTTPQPTTPPTTTASPTPPTVSPPPSPSPSPTGTESVFPGGGALLVAPGWHGAQVYLSAYGGPVNWSASVANDPNNAISVSPGSGTLTPGGSVTVTIAASQFVRCGSGSQCPTVTIWPNGTVFTIYTGRGQSVPGNGRQSAPLPSATSSPQGGAPATPPRRHITFRL
jgi:RNA polymerase sigma factor (sigma-70 family)